LKVDNPYSIFKKTIFSNIRAKFWESDPLLWDDINNVGLRNHYICTAYASRLMTARKQGLIVNISSMGGKTYLFNVAYGVGKAALDRMAVDCGIELRKHNVACLSLMLGAVRTEKMTGLVEKGGEKLTIKGDPNSKDMKNASLKKILDDGESVEFGGKVIAHMALNPEIMNFSNKIVIAADYSHKYDIRDVDGRVVPSHREIKNMGALLLPKNLRPLVKYVPFNFKIPQSLIDIVSSKVYRG
jgi:dehydrogenase/reductase SDR family protein 1